MWHTYTCTMQCQKVYTIEEYNRQFKSDKQHQDDQKWQNHAIHIIIQNVQPGIISKIA